MSLVYAPFAFYDLDFLCKPATLAALRESLYDICSSCFPQAVFLRWDVPFEEEVCDPLLLHSMSFYPAAVSVQAPDTVQLNLEQPRDRLFAAFGKKLRYNIRLADKKGVVISQSDDIDAWYDMYYETHKRQGMGIHTRSYYQTVFKSWKREEGDALRLYMASHEGDILAGIIVLEYGDMLTYLYGASSNIKRNYMASSLLQWQAICDAQDNGLKLYDLFGISPTADPSHPLYGLYRFKTSFGGRVLHRPGCWDVPIKPLTYQILSSLERADVKFRALRSWLQRKFIVGP